MQERVNAQSVVISLRIVMEESYQAARQEKFVHKDVVVLGWGPTVLVRSISFYFKYVLASKW